MFPKFLSICAIFLALSYIVIALNIGLVQQRPVEINLIVPLVVFWMLLWQVKGRQET